MIPPPRRSTRPRSATQNTALPTNDQSYSYVITAGADFNAADPTEVQALNSLSVGNGTSTDTGSGSIEIGLLTNRGVASVTGGKTAQTSTALNGYYQVIRTGTGDIDLSAGRNIELLNQFATVYTAGVQVENPTQLPDGSFGIPKLTAPSASQQGSLGSIQGTIYPAEYTLAGGNVSLAAQNDIEHLTVATVGTQIIPDSERELPDNWLYRRGYAANGVFAASKTDTSASTSWWVDFSNFFEGIGALGGGNVTVAAGENVNNVDAVIPTNARLASGVVNTASEVELGGGDLLVTAGHNIDAGVYYVEKGEGTLDAGNSILTNATRSPTLTTLSAIPVVDGPATWLPTTLFLGDSSFTVEAKNNLLLGPAANVFLLPQGVDNTYNDKTYFSTYSPTDSVSVSSLTGAVTLDESTTLPTTSTATPQLESWEENVLLFQTGNASYYQPWLRLDETQVSAFSTVTEIEPGTLNVEAFSGDINLTGNLVLSPSPTGTINLAAFDSINAVEFNGTSISSSGVPINYYSSSTIDLSDASPAAIPGVASPLAYQSLSGVGTTPVAANSNLLNLSEINDLFDESGATEGTSLQEEDKLHAPGVLHTGDPNPVHVYSSLGDVSGLTLFAGKAARVIAGQDLTDIALYVQNVGATDTSIVAAGRDIIAYDPNAPLVTLADLPGNAFDAGSGVAAGDIQIGGPGTLEVLAGRDLTLGVGPSNEDGTAVGITSIGNARNPYLPITDSGASVIAAAGVGGLADPNVSSLDPSASSLPTSTLNFSAFEAAFLNPGFSRIRALPA